MPQRNIDTTEGGGPWTIPDDDLPTLQPGETFRIDLRRLEYRNRKRYFQPWLPVDNVVIKNFDTSSRLSVRYNGQYDAVVEPNAVDSFSSAGVVSILITNDGAGAIESGDIVVQVSVDAYSADQAARDRKDRHPLENIARNLVGL